MLFSSFQQHTNCFAFNSSQDAGSGADGTGTDGANYSMTNGAEIDVNGPAWSITKIKKQREKGKE